ncbi:NifU family protein [Pseudonocardia benzenivorans]|uniref:NifU family protein n=1 Tax=Pseudonocardia benzenivorans TaxID=228005 RepID=A0ABW3VS34_9PSEU|nr:hypothetical protein PSD17_23200 [Pseudonocardia sp. D17]
MTASTKSTPAASSGPAATEAEPSFEDLAGRVDRAVEAASALDGAAGEAAAELRAAIEEIHRVGLRAIVRAMRERPETRDLLFTLVDDPVVHLLLSLHGIVRPDPATHAQRVLTTVRPQLQSHGGDVAFAHVADGVAYVRLEGACNGCSMSAVTLRNLVEEALVAQVPAIRSVEVLPNEPTPTLIAVESMFPRSTGLPPGWVDGLGTDDVAPGALAAVQLAADDGTGADVIVVNVDNRISAYRNACAHEGLPLDGALLDVRAGTLTCPWHGFCYDATSGECLSAPGAQLEQLPVRVDGDRIWVRVHT